MLQSLYTPKFMRIFVIIPAAGLGTRMSAGQAGPLAPKQFLELRGVPILIHTIGAFASLPEVSEIFVAVRKGEMPRVQPQIDAHEFGGKVRVVEGGDSRQEIVAQRSGRGGLRR